MTENINRYLNWQEDNAFSDEEMGEKIFPTSQEMVEIIKKHGLSHYQAVKVLELTKLALMECVVF